jgi:hypothetical protein
MTCSTGVAISTRTNIGGALRHGSVIHYSERAWHEGVALAISASVGYDVDWRTIHKLMIEVLEAQKPLFLHFGQESIAIPTNKVAAGQIPAFLPLAKFSTN